MILVRFYTIYCPKVKPNPAFVAVILICKIDWNVFGSHHWFPYKYRSVKLALVGGFRRWFASWLTVPGKMTAQNQFMSKSPRGVCYVWHVVGVWEVRLAGVIRKKYDEVLKYRLLRLKTRFWNVIWLLWRLSQEKVSYLRLQLQKWIFLMMVVDIETSWVLSARTMWNALMQNVVCVTFEIAVRQRSARFPETVDKEYEIAIWLVDQKVLADASPFAELVPLKDTLAAGQNHSKETQIQLVFFCKSTKTYSLICTRGSILFKMDGRGRWKLDETGRWRLRRRSIRLGFAELWKWKCSKRSRMQLALVGRSFQRSPTHPTHYQGSGGSGRKGSRHVNQGQKTLRAGSCQRSVCLCY